MTKQTEKLTRDNTQVAKDGIFELNGNAYDALTGELLGDARHIQNNATPAVRHMPVHAAQHRSPVVIGGLSAAPSAKPTHKRGQAAANHVTAHQPQPTKTLMRHAVKQPTVQPKVTRPSAIVGAHSNAIHASRTTAPVTKFKPNNGTIDQIRINRAGEAPRSQAVQHFRSLDVQAPRAAHSTAKPVHHSAQVPMQQSTQQAKALSSDIKLIHPQQPAANRPNNRTVMQRRQQQQVQQIHRPVANNVSNLAGLTPMTHQARPTAGPQQPLITTSQHKAVDAEQDLFSQALAHATSHEEPAPHESKISKMKHKGKKRKRVFSIAASLAVFVALCGFVAVQNRENIQVQLAGAKAGFSVATPLYKPDGYTLNKMTSTSGSVASLYKNLGNQSFTLTQKKSNWDSQTLLENFVASSGDDYKGFQSNGRTVYVYGKGKATWVDGGVWYQIQGADDLTNDQLVKIAASM